MHIPETSGLWSTQFPLRFFQVPTIMILLNLKEWIVAGNGFKSPALNCKVYHLRSGNFRIKISPKLVRMF